MQDEQEKVISQSNFIHLENIFEFCYPWISMLLCQEFSLSNIIRLFDTYIADDNLEKFHIYVCAAIILKFSKEFLKLDFG